MVIRDVQVNSFVVDNLVVDLKFLVLRRVGVGECANIVQKIVLENAIVERAVEILITSIIKVLKM